MSVGLATVVLGGPTLAVWSNGHVLPLNALHETASGSGTLPSSLREALPSWERWVELVVDAAERGVDQRWLRAEEVEFLAAAPEPANIYCAGANYYDHAEEMGHERPNKADLEPFLFLASTATLTGHRRPVRRPPGCERFDWEVELAVVIGRLARDVRAEDAPAVIAGYSVANDLSSRDLSQRTDVPFSPDWLRSKCYEGCLPVGPAVVPSALIPDPMNLTMSLSVNGEVMQQSSTSEMIFTLYEQIEYLSAIGPLLPGDIIITGTPAGTGIAWGRYLAPGDHVVAAIDSIGALETSIVPSDRQAPGSDRRSDEQLAGLQ